MIDAFFVSNHCDHIRNRMLALGNDALYRALNAVRNHDFMQNCRCLLDCADYITGYHFVAGFSNRDKLPELFPVQCRNIDASGNAVT